MAQVTAHATVYVQTKAMEHEIDVEIEGTATLWPAYADQFRGDEMEVDLFDVRGEGSRALPPRVKAYILQHCRNVLDTALYEAANEVI